MFDFMVEQNGLMPVFEHYGLLDKDLNFIREQIAGPQHSALGKEVTVLFHMTVNVLLM